ncbi:hypothetical protein E2C01_038423 [Portunus trituberculatus]|uniref:Uncharacterized protein n=1 Tax=Portunus trituberculatus TaxID=210409 RepID=A0A5B7FHY0_PORTR|nr:hypothetical protein [Portunus trituberculatus]
MHVRGNGEFRQTAWDSVYQSGTPSRANRDNNKDSERSESNKRVGQDEHKKSNFQAVEHHLSSTKPHHLFLTEIQLPEASDRSPFSVPSYFLYPHFRSKAVCCVYVRNDITCCRADDLESSKFSII